MPNIKSAKKRVIVNAKKTGFNKDNKSEVKSAIRKLNAVIESGNYEEAVKLFPETASVIDSSVAKETEEFLLSLIGKPTYDHLEKGAEIAFMDKKNNGSNVSFVAIAGEGKTKEIVLTQKRFGEILVDL